MYEKKSIKSGIEKKHSIFSVPYYFKISNLNLLCLQHVANPIFFKSGFYYVADFAKFLLEIQFIRKSMKHSNMLIERVIWE